MPRGHIGAVSVAGVAVFAAGRTASGRTQVVDYFDIATGLWTSSQIPGSVPRDDMVAASAGSLAFFTKGSFCRICPLHDGFSHFAQSTAHQTPPCTFLTPRHGHGQLRLSVLPAKGLRRHLLGLWLCLPAAAWMVWLHLGHQSTTQSCEQYSPFLFYHFP